MMQAEILCSATEGTKPARLISQTPISQTLYCVRFSSDISNSSVDDAKLKV
jgi:hypothetical protein